MSSANGYHSGATPFESGHPVSARQLELMRQADQRCLPQPGLGTRIRQTPSGTIITSTARSRRGSTARRLGPFAPYSIPYTGSGKAPDDWGLRFRMIPGVVSSTFPSNFTDVFTAPSDVEMHFCYLETSIDQLGRVAGAMIRFGANPPVNEEPDLDGMLPPQINTALWAMDTNDKKILRVYSMVESNLRVRVEASFPACEKLLRTVSVIAD